ncbi:MAG: hypothetical protein M1831_007302 [Alyxoria varia]|nr:MAG: hypothetical protein M1831_007302 [Alyxoria varia]
MSAVHDPSHFTDGLFYLIIFTYTELWLILIASSLPAVWPYFSGRRRSQRSRPKNNRHSSNQPDVDLNRMVSVRSDSTAAKTPRQHTISQYGGSTAESIKTPVPVHRGVSVKSTFSRSRRSTVGSKTPHVRTESVEKIMPHCNGTTSGDDNTSNSGRNSRASWLTGDDDLSNPFGDHNVHQPEKSIVVTKDITVKREDSNRTGNAKHSPPAPTFDSPGTEHSKRASTTTGYDDVFFESR